MGKQNNTDHSKVGDLFSKRKANLMTVPAIRRLTNRAPVYLNYIQKLNSKIEELIKLNIIDETSVLAFLENDQLAIKFFKEYVDTLLLIAKCKWHHCDPTINSSPVYNLLFEQPNRIQALNESQAMEINSDNLFFDLSNLQFHYAIALYHALISKYDKAHYLNFALKTMRSINELILKKFPNMTYEEMTNSDDDLCKKLQLQYKTVIPLYIEHRSAVLEHFGWNADDLIHQTSTAPKAPTLKGTQAPEEEMPSLSLKELESPQAGMPTLSVDKPPSPRLSVKDKSQPSKDLKADEFSLKMKTDKHGASTTAHSTLFSCIYRDDGCTPYQTSGVVKAIIPNAALFAPLKADRQKHVPEFRSSLEQLDISTDNLTVSSTSVLFKISKAEGLNDFIDTIKQHGLQICNRYGDDQCYIRISAWRQWHDQICTQQEENETNYTP